MAVETTNAIDGPYVANGVTTAFPFTFTALSPNDVAVFSRSAEGVDTEITSGFVVAIEAGGGGGVTFDTPPTSGSLFIYLNPDMTRTTDFAQGGAYLARAHNAGFDRDLLRSQALRRDVDRSIRTPLGEAGVELPVAAKRANGFLAFDTEGKAYRSAGTGADAGLRTDLADFGALLIGFIQAGVGAVLRTVQAKLRERVSVLDFGADPTGVTESTTAFQAAAAANPSGEIIIPIGRYKLGSVGGTLAAGQRWTAESKYGAIIEPVAGFTGAIFSNTNQATLSTAYCGFSGIRFDLKGEACTAIDLASINNSYVRDCYFDGGAGFGAASITNGSPVVTLNGTTETNARVKVGQKVFGPFIPAGTTVLSKAGLNQFTMSANATATNASTQVYAVAGVGVRCAAPLDAASYTNHIQDCAALYMDRPFVAEDAANENLFTNNEAIACHTGFDVENGVDTVRIIGGRAEGGYTGLRTGGRELTVVSVRFENNFGSDVEFVAGSERPAFLSCYTATSLTTFLNASNSTGLFSRGGSFPQRDLEPNVSNPILSAARHVFAAAGQTPVVHALTDFSAYFQNYALLKNGISVEFSNAAATNSIVGLQANASDELVLPGFNRLTAAYVKVKVGDSANPTVTFDPINRTIEQRTTTVGGLPAAGIIGRRAFVTDANAATFGTTVAAGGANKVPVYDNGTNWIIG